MTDAQEYSKNIDGLLTLVRDVVNQLQSSEEKTEKQILEVTLKELNRAISSLSKQGIMVPEALEYEQMRLSEKLSTKSENELAFTRLINGLEEILREVNPQSKSNRAVTRTRPSNKSPKTPESVLREYIIEALRYFGGSSPKRDVHSYIEEALKDRFLPGDFEWRDSTNEYAWKNNVDWARSHLVDQGVMKKGSPIGIWELNDDYL